MADGRYAPETRSALSGQISWRSVILLQRYHNFRVLLVKRKNSLNDCA